MSDPVDYAAVVDQEEAIRQEIAATQPLVGPPEDLAVLLEQYKDNAPFLPKIAVGGGTGPASLVPSA